jgi:hypothetical protein
MTVETSLTLTTSDSVTLAARLQPGTSGQGAVICHPHPLYGGTMDNNVVLVARDALAGLGLATLRFDFRGAGRSGGSYDGGQGEQLDLVAAFGALAAESPTGIHLVAYSFGAWVACRALANLELGLKPASVVLISPPCSFGELDFTGLPMPFPPTLVVVGDRDGFCSLGDLDRWMGRGDPGLSSKSTSTMTRKVLGGVDHFYRGAEGRLREALVEWMGTI